MKSKFLSLNGLNRLVNYIKQKANLTDIPTKTSTLTNDSNFINQTDLEEYAQPVGIYATNIDINDLYNELKPLFKDINYDTDNGNLVITRHNNTIVTINLPLKEILKTGYLDKTDEGTYIVLVLANDTEIRIPATALVDDYYGDITTTIQVDISDDNIITANIINGSITKELLSIELQNKINNAETLISSAELKSTLVDADTIPLTDSTTSNITKKITWVNFKSTLRSYFDGLYNKIVVNNTLTSDSTSEALSAAQGKALKAAVDAKYTKPISGISKTDLESSVQTSLSRADTALQSVPTATISEPGLMSSEDKNKLDNIDGDSCISIVNF